MAPLGGHSQDHGFAASSEGGQGGTVGCAPDSGVGPCLPSDFWQVAAPSRHWFAWSVGRGMDGLSVFSGASGILVPREAVVKELQAHVCFSWSSSMCPHVVLAPRKF